MLLVEELTAACPDVDPLGCRVVEVSIIRLRSVIKPDLSRLRIRHIYVLSLEPKPWMVRIMTKPLITSLLLSTLVLSHQKVFMKYLGNSSWCVKMVHT